MSIPLVATHVRLFPVFEFPFVVTRIEKPCRWYEYSSNKIDPPKVPESFYI
jgi:hypothetical protein